MMPPFGSCLRFGGIAFLDAPLTGYTWPAAAGAVAFWARLANATYLQAIKAIACSGLEVDFRLSGQSSGGPIEGGSGPAAYLPQFVAPSFSNVGPCAINAGEWHHYVVSYSSSQAKGYIDGVLATQGSAASSAPTASDLNVAATGFPGTNNIPSNTFPGDFSDVRVFPSQLSPAQVLQLYGAGHGSAIPLGTELVWIPCNSLNVADQSGNGYNGVLYGQPELVPA